MSDKKKLDEAATLNVSNADGDVNSSTTFSADDLPQLALLLKHAGVESAMFNGPASLSVDQQTPTGTVSTSIQAPDLRSIMNMMEPDFQAAGDMEDAVNDTVSDMEPETPEIAPESPVEEPIDDTGAVDAVVDDEGNLALADESIEPVLENSEDDFYEEMDRFDPSNLTQEMGTDFIGGTYQDYDVAYKQVPAGVEISEADEDDLIEELMRFADKPEGPDMVCWVHLDENGDPDTSVPNTLVVGWAVGDGDGDDEDEDDLEEASDADLQTFEVSVECAWEAGNDEDEDEYEDEDDDASGGWSTHWETIYKKIQAATWQEAKAMAEAEIKHYGGDVDPQGAMFEMMDNGWEEGNTGSSMTEEHGIWVMNIVQNDRMVYVKEDLTEEADYDYREHDVHPKTYTGLGSRDIVQPDTKRVPARSSDNPMPESKTFSDYVREAQERNPLAEQEAQKVTTQTLLDEFRLQELSRDTLDSYTAKAKASKASNEKKAGTLDDLIRDREIRSRAGIGHNDNADARLKSKRAKHDRNAWKREKGLDRLGASDDQLDEISNDTKNSYFKKAADQINRHANHSAMHRELGNHDMADQHDALIAKRAKGMNAAIAKEDHTYSAKAASKGKDLGKPGKNFDKIAKKAAKEYGSKEAGERVAGAILSKLRHKHESMEEDLDIKDIKNHEIDLDDPANDEVENLRKASPAKRSKIIKDVERDMHEDEQPGDRYVVRSRAYPPYGYHVVDTHEPDVWHNAVTPITKNPYEAQADADVLNGRPHPQDPSLNGEVDEGYNEDYRRKVNQYGEPFYLNTDCGYASLEDIKAGAGYFDYKDGFTVLEMDRNGKKGLNYITGYTKTPIGTKVTCVTQTRTGQKFRPGVVVAAYTDDEVEHQYENVAADLARLGITPTKKLSVKTFD